MHDLVLSVDAVNRRQDDWLLSAFHFVSCVLTVFLSYAARAHSCDVGVSACRSAKINLLLARKQSLQLTCRDVDVRMSEKRETIGDGLSTETDDVLQKELDEFDDKIRKIVRA